MAQSLEDADLASGSAPPTATYEIQGAGGVRLHAREWGRPDGPEIVFIHGWSMCDLCWTKQTSSQLADEFRIVTFDLRGHGLSDKPSGAEHYNDGQLWADDLAAVLEQTGLERPVVVAWSYGGLVACDYLRVHGDDRIAGLELVAGAVQMNPSFDHIGPGLLENSGGACAFDLATNISAIERFLHACTADPLPDDEFRSALGWSMVVPPKVRRGLFVREVDGRAALAALTAPVLVTHGTVDEIILPSMVDDVVRSCDKVEVSRYEGIGHMTFWEAPDRFNRELAQFASDVFSPA
jgi:non-heme chloroperoxidase